ncbi:MAG: decaprenyl-phosphate phosphoribosyltransferase [Hydrogenophilales bacterium]|nr:decaprenyl-phosphate phosphoribosyltransferase [Hydrogenophilales bacterium]
MHPSLKLLRPHQYLKNGFVLLGVLFSGQWLEPVVLQAFIAFMAFCAMSSAVYVLNDLLDIEADRQHPVKRNRPLAAGQVSVRTGWLLAAAASLLGMMLGALVNAWVLGLLVIYALINVAYSIRLKHVVVLDVFIISAGFMLRILAGTSGLGIDPSSWLLLCGFMLTLFLGFTKRRSELLTLEQSGVHDRALTRQVLDDYSPIVIEQFMAISAACTILAYGLYTVSEDTVVRHGTDDLIYSLPFVVYGVFRYIYLLHRKGKGGDAARDLSDPHILTALLGWFITVILVLS